ncbi:hypothetical protein Taro_003020 [Colocasia esculenta]|uniref:Uncharacterized protein n=1 Tax=Colocasia esculenta TaxID=4460 RepID=A0A843TKR0_COLES|nr:hypothetical protein [Colocasia esculenta]
MLVAEHWSSVERGGDGHTNVKGPNVSGSSISLDRVAMRKQFKQTITQKNAENFILVWYFSNGRPTPSLQANLEISLTRVQSPQGYTIPQLPAGPLPFRVGRKLTSVTGQEATLLE